MKDMKIGYERVGMSMAAVKKVAAKNLPRATWVNDTGIVSRVSWEPTFLSSENRRMVIAGMINEKVMGKREKKSLRSALPKMKKVEKKNHPVTMRNIEITIYAMGDMK
jgi:hypothetical protein